MNKKNSSIYCSCKCYDVFDAVQVITALGVQQCAVQLVLMVPRRACRESGTALFVLQVSTVVMISSFQFLL